MNECYNLEKSQHSGALKTTLLAFLNFEILQIRLWKCLKNSNRCKLLSHILAQMLVNSNEYTTYLHLNSYSGDLLKMTFLGQPAKSNLTIRL